MGFNAFDRCSQLCMEAFLQTQLEDDTNTAPWDVMARYLLAHGIFVLPAPEGTAVFRICYADSLAICQECFAFDEDKLCCDAGFSTRPIHEITPKEKMCPLHELCIHKETLTAELWTRDKDKFGKTLFLSCDDAYIALEKLKGKDVSR